jgi:hypothetical protein
MKRATLSREQLGIVDTDKDVYETADVPEPAELSDEVQQLKRELEANLKSSKEDRPAQPGPIDRAALDPNEARLFFKARDLVSLPPETDFSHQAHERKRHEWRILGSHHRALETPFDRYTRLLAEVQALQRDLELVEEESCAEGVSTEQLYPSHIRHEVAKLISRVELLHQQALPHPLLPNTKGEAPCTSLSSSSATARLLSITRRLQEQPHQGSDGAGAGVGAGARGASRESSLGAGVGGGCVCIFCMCGVVSAFVCGVRVCFVYICMQVCVCARARLCVCVCVHHLFMCV